MPALARRPHLVLAALYVTAAALHALASRGHVTPFVFPDELAYVDVARSFAEGAPFQVRGEWYWFSAPLAALVQAPVWLVEDVGASFAAAKTVNALVMSAALFPAYRIAVRLGLGTAAALAAAAATVVAPALVFHAFLLSEALAYPLFLVAVAAIVEALETPTRAARFAVLAALAAAALTRVQFLVLPAAYAAALVVVPLVRRESLTRSLRLHAPVLAPFAGFAVVALLAPYVVKGGYYSDLPTPTPAWTIGDAAGWAAQTASFLPWALGWLALPVALGGLVALVRGRTPAGVGFAAVTVTTVIATYAEIGAVRAGDWHHPTVERYAIYLFPLAAMALLAAPARSLFVAGAALATAAAAWAVTFPTAAPFVYAFDSTTRSAYAWIGQWLDARGLADSYATGARALASLALVAVAALAWRGRARWIVPAATFAFLLVTTVAYYRLDSAVTRGIERAWLASPADWLDRAELGGVDYLELPNAHPPLVREAEIWNRSLERVAYLRAPRAANDRFPSRAASVAADGTLLVDGRPLRGGALLVHDFGSTIRLDGEPLPTPRAGLTVWRLGEGARVAWLAEGLSYDRWAGREVRFESWPAPREGARYRVQMLLPEGRRPRTVTLVAGDASRTVRVGPGERADVELPASGPLVVRTSAVDLIDERRNPRRVGVRVTRLEVVP